MTCGENVFCKSFRKVGFCILNGIMDYVFLFPRKCLRLFHCFCEIINDEVYLILLVTLSVV